MRRAILILVLILVATSAQAAPRKHARPHGTQTIAAHKKAKH